MARKCVDCEQPVVWLRKPDGGWLPPVEPVLDLAYGDHFISTADGTAAPMPQVYRKHECLTWDQKQVKAFERQQEKQRLIEEDRERRRQVEAAQRQVQIEHDREVARLEREAAALRRASNLAEAQKVKIQIATYSTKRLLTVECRDCEAEVGEACRTSEYFGKQHPHTWWMRGSAHSARYMDAPPDDRSKLRLTEYWGDDYNEATGAGTTPETCGPWPPRRNEGGRYDLRNWLAKNAISVFEPEKWSLSRDEQVTLTDWFHQFGDLFEKEEDDDDRGVVEADGIAGAEGAGGGHAGREGVVQAEGDRVDPDGPRDAGEGDGEQGDRGSEPWWHLIARAPDKEESHE